MLNFIRKMHRYLLLPVTVIAILLSFLRFGLHNHPAYHYQVESWLSDTFSQDVTFDDFSLVLSGSQFQIDVDGIDLGIGDVSSQSVSFTINIWHWLFKPQVTIDQLHLTDVRLTVAQQADGQWHLLQNQQQNQIQEQKSARADTPALSDNTAYVDNNVSGDIPALEGVMQALDRINQFSGDQATITLLPYQADAMALADVDFQLRQQTGNVWTINLQGQPVNKTMQTASASVQANAEIALSDTFVLQEINGFISADKLPLPSGWPQPVAQEVTVKHITGDFWLQYNIDSSQVRHAQIEEVAPQTIQLQGRNLTIEGEFRQQPWQWQSDVDLVYAAQQWDWTFTNITGGMQMAQEKVTAKDLRLSWPVQHLQGHYVAGQLALYSQAINLPAMTQWMIAIDTLPDQVSRPVQALNPQGTLKNAYFHWQQMQPADFLLHATMQQVGVSNWKGVPSVTGANGQISLTATGGKVTLVNDSNINIHIPDLKVLPWQFDAMSGQIAWQRSQQEIYLDTSQLHILQGQSSGYLSLSGQFPIKANNNAEPQPVTEPAQSNSLTSRPAKVQVEFRAADYSVHQLAEILPDAVGLPTWLLDLNLTGDINISAEAKRLPAEASQQPKVSFAYTIDGHNLAGFDKTRQITIEQANVSLEQLDDRLNQFAVKGLVNGEGVSLALVDNIAGGSQQYAKNNAIWQGLDAKQWRKGGAWLYLEGDVSQQTVIELLDASSPVDAAWLPQQAKIEAYIPSCLLQRSPDCMFAAGKLHFSDNPSAWPNVIEHTGELAWTWSDTTYHDSNTVNQSGHKHHQLLLSNGMQSIHLALQDNTIQGMGVGLSIPAPQVSQGLVVHGQLDRVDAEEWLTSLQSVLKTPALVASDEIGKQISNQDDYREQFLHRQLIGSGAIKLTLPPLLQAEIQIGELHWQERLFNDVDIAYTRDLSDKETVLNVDQAWALVMVSQQLAAELVSSGNEEPLLLDVEYLRLSSQPEEITPSQQKVLPDVDLLQDIEPSLIPDMDITIQELRNNERVYGAWQAKVRNQDGKLFVHDLTADMGHSQLSGNLIWSKQDEQHNTIFSGTITANAVADALENWGYTATIDSSDGTLDVHLNWPASPLAFNIETSAGDISLRIKQGQLRDTPSQLETSKIIALLDFDKLLSVLTLQFSDIATGSYDFDHIVAYYEVKEGVAKTTRPAEFMSSGMELSLEGTIDFDQRTLNNDLYLTVPLVEKLPLVALLTGSPQLSGLLYIVERLIGDELATFTSLRMSITGDLDDPAITLQQVFDTNNDVKGLNERANNVFQLQ